MHVYNCRNRTKENHTHNNGYENQDAQAQMTRTHPSDGSKQSGVPNAESSTQAKRGCNLLMDAPPHTNIEDLTRQTKDRVRWRELTHVIKKNVV